MVESEKVFSLFIQTVNSCVLASYAIAANYFTKVEILEYFKAYCCHYNITEIDSNPYIRNGIKISAHNHYEVLYDSHFHNEYNRRRKAGLKIIEELHKESIQSAFVEARNSFDVKHIDNVLTCADKIEVKLKEEEALLILAFRGAGGGRHTAVFGYEDERWYTVETRQYPQTGIVYCDNPFKEPGDALLATRKKD